MNKKELKENVKKVVQGAVAMGVLMNIHSYDALLIGLVLIGFICSLLGAKLLSKEWFLQWFFLYSFTVGRSFLNILVREWF